MDLFNEIDDLNDLFLFDKNSKLEDGIEDLQSKYSNLHENYSKEVENSKKVEKSLVKCLKFYSKLSKKYEAQQKIIQTLEENIRDKAARLEEAQRNEERMKGLIEIYRTERTIYAGESCSQLRKDKEILLDICCKLIKDSVTNNNIRNMINVLLRKFRKDLDDDKVVVLKGKLVKIKDEWSGVSDVKPDCSSLKSEMKFNETKVEVKEQKEEEKEEEEEEKSDPLDLSMKTEDGCEMTQNGNGGVEYEETVTMLSSLPSFNEPLTPLEPPEEKHLEDTILQVVEESHSIITEELPSPPITVPAVTVVQKESSGHFASIFDVPEVIGKEKKAEEEEEVPNLVIGEVSKEIAEVCTGEGDDTTFPYEEELRKIFREMTSVRLLSPIRERPCGASKRRSSNGEENGSRSKKLKGQGDSCNLLDSIMSAMSVQNEEFKSGGSERKEPEREEGFKPVTLSPRKGTGFKESRTRKSLKKNEEQLVDRAVTNEIKNFVSSPISCKEDADKYVARCLSALSNKPEDAIAKCVVAIVLENVDETVEVFERPSPPLTKTQHRLMVLLSVFRTLDSNFEKISEKILSMLWEKLLPDNFFWPDDCVEAASRFYAALCRARNDAKTLWRFCLHSMTDMRQRSPLVVFTVLKTWPDVLHDAATLKSNMVATTVANLFLHMPKKEGLRNLNQSRKLVALKHLLMNFYGFKVEDTIENFARKLYEGVEREEPGSEKAFALLAKCRDSSWTTKNLAPMLKSTLSEWSEGKTMESVAVRVLSVMKHMCATMEEDNPKTKELIRCLSDILNSGEKCHESEVAVVEVLLELKQHPEARKVIREWIPKKPIYDALRNDIINVSAVNILRELKVNGKKEPKKYGNKSKMKKKGKGKKRKGKKTTKKTKAESSAASS